MIDQAWVQLNLARVYAKLEALKVLNWRSAWSITAGVPNMAEASAVKVMGTEFFVECYRILLEVVGVAGLVPAGEPGALFDGMLEHAYRSATTLTQKTRPSCSHRSRSSQCRAHRATNKPRRASLPAARP